MNYWPGFVDALVDADPVHHLHSDRVRRRAVLSAAGSRRQGHRAQPAERADRRTHRPSSRWRKSGKASAEDMLAQLRASLAHRRKATATNTKASPRGAGAGVVGGARSGQRTHEPTRRREENLRPRAWPRSKSSISRSRRCAGSWRSLNSLSPPTEQKDKESQARIADPRHAAQFGAGRARVQELTKFRLPTSSAKLREILGNRPDVRIRRRPPSCCNPKCSSTSARPSCCRPAKAELDKVGRRASRPGKADPGRHRPGCCVSMATPTCGRSPASSNRTGTSPPAGAIAVGAVSDQQGRVAAASGRRRFSANSQPIDRRQDRRRLQAQTAASSFKLDRAVNRPMTVYVDDAIWDWQGRKCATCWPTDIDETAPFREHARAFIGISYQGPPKTPSTALRP